MAQEIKRVAVVGGAGYLGSTLCALLVNQGFEVVSIDAHWFGDDALHPLRGHPFFSSLKIDVPHGDEVIPHLRGCEAVIWVAGLVGDPACDLDIGFTYSCNYRSVLTLAHICKWLGIRRFIFASSCSVYGKSSIEVAHLNEESATCPLSFYARDKLACEKTLRMMADDSFHPSILRLATLFGWSNRMRFDLVVNVLSARAWRGDTLEIFGGGQRRPFLHVKDAARAFATVLSSEVPLVSGGIFNVGADANNHRISEIADLVYSAVPDVKVKFMSEAVDLRDYDVDFSKISDTLSYRTEFSVFQGIVEIQQRLSESNGINIGDPLYVNEKRTRQLISENCTNGRHLQSITADLVGSAA
jgi:nucleoside-diphosphate-sugar epimerase